MAERIRVQTLDGAWETLGIDRNPGIFPEAIQPTYNSGGPDALTFTLRRDPALEYPDIEGDTPVELVGNGDRVVWAGYTLEAPGSDDAVTIQARGWQHHAAGDDLISRTYVLERMDAWRDARDAGATLVSASGASGFGPSLVATVGETIRIGQTQGNIWKAGHGTGVTHDFGPDADSWPVAVAFGIRTVGGAPGGISLLVRNHSSPSNAHPGVAGEFQDALVFAFSTLTTAVSDKTATFSSPRRYLTIFLARDLGPGDYTPTAEDLAELTYLRTFSDEAYRAGPDSGLTADEVIKDARDRGCPLLSPSNELITATTLPIRELELVNEPPRTAWDRVNGYHGWRLKVLPDRRVQYGPLPDRPVLVVNTTAPGVALRDVSRQSTADVINKVIVRGRSGSGRELRVTRYSPPAGGAAIIAGTAGYSDAGGGGIYSETAQGASVRAADVTMRLPTNAGITISASGHFLIGRTYIAELDVTNTPITGDNTTSNRFTFGSATDSTTLIVTMVPGVKRRIRLVWTPSSNQTGVTIKALAHTDQAHRIDVAAPAIVGGDDTVPGRRGKSRTRLLDVQAPTDETAMIALGDAYLRIHERTSFKGDLTISSDDAVRRVGTEEPVPRLELGAFTTELILIDNLVDPDGNGLGRNGIIANVAGGAGDQPATLTLDNDRSTFEALLARMGVVTRSA